ncbi:MAG: hypothetical protein R2881_07860 [Eubacteriales bacterium]
MENINVDTDNLTSEQKAIIDEAQRVMMAMFINGKLTDAEKKNCSGSRE